MTKVWLGPVISMAISGIIGAASHYFNYTTLAESVIIGLLCTAVAEMTILITNISSVAIRNQVDSNALAKYLDRIESSYEADAKISELARNFASIASEKHGPNDVFLTHLTTELEILRRKAADAVKQKEVVISSDYIINVDGVFDSLNVSSEREVMLTYPIYPGVPWIGSRSDRRFLEVLLEKANRGEVHKVKILFLCDETIALHDGKIWKLCHALAQSKGVHAKVANLTDFQQICKTNGVDENYLDFGIYGPEMLFRTTIAGPESSGIYSKDRKLVQRYKSVFNQFWNSNDLCVLPDLPPTGEKVKIGQLFELEFISRPVTQIESEGPK